MCLKTLRRCQREGTYHARQASLIGGFASLLLRRSLVALILRGSERRYSSKEPEICDWYCIADSFRWDSRVLLQC